VNNGNHINLNPAQHRLHNTVSVVLVEQADNQQLNQKLSSTMALADLLVKIDPKHPKLSAILDQILILQDDQMSAKRVSERVAESNANLGPGTANVAVAQSVVSANSTTASSSQSTPVRSSVATSKGGALRITSTASRLGAVSSAAVGVANGSAPITSTVAALPDSAAKKRVVSKRSAPVCAVGSVMSSSPVGSLVSPPPSQSFAQLPACAVTSSFHSLQIPKIPDAELARAVKRAKPNQLPKQ